MGHQLWQRLTSNSRTTWLPFLFIVVLALLIRIPYLPGNGFAGDLGIFQNWVTIIQNKGLFHFYETVKERSYPPISIVLLSMSDGSFADMKLASLIAEIMIVATAYLWLRRTRILGWLIPAFLALHPGLILTTAWWGQNDALFTLAVVLVLLALNRDRPLLAWVLLGVALATKQQSIVVTPVVFILSFRRYGWRRTGMGVLLAALVVIGTTLPFLLASDLNTAFSSYGVIFGAVSSLTNNALNLWYLITKLSGLPMSTVDRNPFIASLTYGQTGLLLLASYTVIVSVVMWKRFDQRREFIWASALYVGSFTLQTQIHERYLYPACVLALLGLVQDRRMGLAALGLSLTFTFNLVDLAVPTTWLGIPLMTAPEGAVPIALLNLLLLFEMVRVVVTTRPALSKRFSWVMFNTGRVMAAGLVAVVFFSSVGLWLSNWTVADWLTDHAADHTRVVVDQTARFAALLTPAEAHLEWQSVKDVTEKDSLAWMGDGVHYMVADLSTNPSTAQRLADEATTLLYARQGAFPFGRDLAVYWTFRPDHLLDITFDNSLRLVGYNLLSTEQGTRLLLHWYAEQEPSTAYSVFVHLIDPTSGDLIGQADYPLGGASHPSDTWHRNELVFEPVDLPAARVPIIIRLGLYQADRRAAIQAADGTPLGDHVDLPP